MSLSLQQEIINDLIAIENDLGNPSFVWNNTTYNFIPSIAEFQRELDTGGFKLVRVLTATVRILDSNYNVIFSSLPSPQQKITYNLDGNTYRVESVKQDTTGAYFRIIAASSSKGI